MNKGALLKEMDSFIKEFMSFKELIENEDTEAMREAMRRATGRRTLFDKPKH